MATIVHVYDVRCSSVLKMKILVRLQLLNSLFRVTKIPNTYAPKLKKLFPIANINFSSTESF